MSIKLEDCFLPRTGAIRSVALAMTSSSPIGFLGVPRTASIRSVSIVPSFKKTSTIATRTGINCFKSSLILLENTFKYFTSSSKKVKLSVV